MKANIQLQDPGTSFKKPSITLTRGGDTILINISKKKRLEIIKMWKDVPREG